MDAKDVLALQVAQMAARKVAWGPVIDGVEFTEHPVNLAKSGTYLPVYVARSKLTSLRQVR